MTNNVTVVRHIDDLTIGDRIVIIAPGFPAEVMVVHDRTERGYFSAVYRKGTTQEQVTWVDTDVLDSCFAAETYRTEDGRELPYAILLIESDEEVIGQD